MKLNTSQTDELVRKAATPEDGAIEDCEEFDTKVVYFFESGKVVTIKRATGAVTIKQFGKSSPWIGPLTEFEALGEKFYPADEYDEQKGKPRN